jgi:hypothetical protein
MIAPTVESQPQELFAPRTCLPTFSCNQDGKSEFEIAGDKSSFTGCFPLMVLDRVSRCFCVFFRIWDCGGLAIELFLRVLATYCEHFLSRLWRLGD